MATSVRPNTETAVIVATARLRVAKPMASATVSGRLAPETRPTAAPAARATRMKHTASGTA